MKILTEVPAGECRPMTKLETELFIVLSLEAHDVRDPVPAAKLDEALGKLFKPAFTQDMATQILLKRLQQTDKEYDPRVVAMVSFLSDRPGFAVLWAYTLYRRTVELGRPYLFDDLIHDFPMGFPTNEGAGKIWDTQKGWSQEPPQKVDNMLDQAVAWKESSEAAAQ